MSNLIKDAAREAAEDVLSQHWTPRTFPVDPALIALRMGLKVFRAQLPQGTSGMIIKSANKPAEIYFAEDEAPQRQNFTCAHELGHYVERSDRDQPDVAFEFVDRRNGTVNAHEFYANEFAGNLLMPVDDLRAEVAWGATDHELARRYGVSVHAILVRKTKLGIGS